MPISLRLPHNEPFQGTFVELREAFTHRLGRTYREPHHQPDSGCLTQMADLLAALANAQKTEESFKYLDVRSDTPGHPTRHVLITVALNPMSLGARGGVSKDCHQLNRLLDALLRDPYSPVEGLVFCSWKALHEVLEDPNTTAEKILLGHGGGGI